MRGMKTESNGSAKANKAVSDSEKFSAARSDVGPAADMLTG